MGSISKSFSLLLVLVLTFSILTMIVAQTVEAQIGVDVEPGPTTTFVNQPVEFTATASMGTPPYSYQWYTQLWSKDPNTPTASPEGNLTAVSGANSSRFNFTASSTGIYDISIRVSDSANNSVYDAFQPSGIQVTVLPTQIHPSTTLTPTSTPTVPEFPTLIIRQFLQWQYCYQQYLSERE
ncbi:MAG: PKD domain-containing protein [Candidatus Bathyarchaeia archaeon]|jgi:hypothetical protein